MYCLYVAHAIDCTSFIDDPKDLEMWQIIDFLENIVNTRDVRQHCRSWKKWVVENQHVSTVPDDMLRLHYPNYNPKKTKKKVQN